LEHARACLAKDDGCLVVEEYLDGPEVSLFCIADGTDVVALAPAQDFKRVGDGDSGPNTGGMGAYSPLPWCPENLVEDVLERVARPTITEMARRGTPFVGVLYVGLALTSRGTRVVEFNARFGDPETQVVLPRLRSPFGALLFAAATGRLAELPPLQWHQDAAVTVVIASQGYPGEVHQGDEISGIADAESIEGVHVLHAGTAIQRRPAGDEDAEVLEGRLVSHGGRVLSVVGLGADLAAAREAAYAGAAQIELEGSHHRSDIALAAVEGLVSA